MKNKRLLDIFGEIDDRHIAEAAPVAKKSRNKPIWFSRFWRHIRILTHSGIWTTWSATVPIRIGIIPIKNIRRSWMRSSVH